MRLIPVIAMLMVIISVAAAYAADVEDAPTALVFEHVDQWTGSARAADLLEAAGFEVAPLPLDRSPVDLDADVIVIGSFVSEHPDYAAYLKAHSAGLREFVAAGHLLVQFTQADQTEASPPFLPAGLAATRCDGDHGQALILSPGHTLLSGLYTPGGAITFSPDRTVWEAFNHQRGFDVLMAADSQARYPVLAEGAYGRGRILLVAMALDKDNMGSSGSVDPGAFNGFRERFFTNLYRYAIDVRGGEARPLDVTETPPDVPAYFPGSWTLAVLPDTQYYARYFPEQFSAQTAWIAGNVETLAIEYVIGLGDITDTNSPVEWDIAADAYCQLGGRVPCAIVPGNHDYGPGGNAATRETLLNDYFSFDDQVAMPTFGGAYEDGRLDNTFHLFSAGGTEWVVLALEWAPRDEVVTWAGRVMQEHPGRRGILVTHTYMYHDDTRTDHLKPPGLEDYNCHNYSTPGSLNDGQELWDKLVSRHDIPLVLSGHILGDGTGYRVDENEAGTPVHQILANYQMRKLGGGAYLRLLEFRPDGTIQVKSYSPLQDSYLLEPDQQFSFVLE